VHDFESYRDMRKNKRLSFDERRDAVEALALLAGSGLTLAQAARLALHLEGPGTWEDVSIERAIDDFLADCRARVKRKALRARTADFYEENLWPFESAFPGKRVGDLDRQTLQAYFDQYPGKALTVDARFRAVRAWLNWCERQEPALVRDNPLRRVRLPQVVREEEIGFLTLDDVKAVLTAPPPYKWAIALQLFAGLRPEEITSPNKPGLRWEHIDREARTIRIPAEMAKGSRRGSMARIIDQAPDNLWSWLADAPAAGAVLDRSPGMIRATAKRLAGFGPDKPWIPDGLRHTFATYHTAAFNDVGKTSLIMGHRGDPSMLHRHYRGLTTRAQGEAYFALRGD
jgi:integrase